SGQREQVPEGREDRVSVDLASAGHLPGGGGYAAEACPARGGRDEPGRVRDIGADLGARAWTYWAGPVRVAPPVAGAVDRPAGKSRINRDSIVDDGHVEVVLVHV